MPQLPTSGMIEVLADMQFSAAMSTYAMMPHGLWGGLVNTSMAAFGLTTTREFSNAVTDCDLWVNGVNLGIRYDGTYTIGTWPNAGNCDQWTKWENYDVGTKNDICHV
jgi:glucan 1,3-beta-glucosidase